MIVIGVDPGAKGAIALLRKFDIVVVPLQDIAWLVGWMKSYIGDVNRCHIFIERAQAFPGQGSVSMFNYGKGYGELLGCVAAFAVPHTLVSPREWTSQLHKGCKAGTPKARSLEAVKRLFPQVQLIPDGCRKPHEGIVDSLLIAEWGRRHLGGKSESGAESRGA